MDKIKSIQDRIFGGNKKTFENPDTLISLHHIFIRNYGWIPLEEFKKIPIMTFLNLLQEIGKEAEETQKSMKVPKRKW